MGVEVASIGSGVSLVFFDSFPLAVSHPSPLPLMPPHPPPPFEQTSAADQNLSGESSIHTGGLWPILGPVLGGMTALIVLGVVLTVRRAASSKQHREPEFSAAAARPKPQIYRPNYVDTESPQLDVKEETSLVEQLSLFRVAEISSAAAPVKTAIASMLQPCDVGMLSDEGGATFGLPAGAELESVTEQGRPTSRDLNSTDKLDAKGGTNNQVSASASASASAGASASASLSTRTDPLMVDGDAPIGLLPCEAQALEDLRRSQGASFAGAQHLVDCNEDSGRVSFPEFKAIHRARAASEAMRI